MARVTCTDLRKVFPTPAGNEVAVDSISMTLEDGEFTTLVGPSGCGKTTLLRMISGLETPTEGRITFDEDDVTNLRPQNRDISMVFQDIALFPFKTVRENIEYGLKYTDVDGETRDEQVEEMARITDIEELLDKKPNQLSGGQQQRVALSRSLIRSPAIFLLDEPMSDLDAKLKIEMRAELKELHREFQTTTLYVTHDQEEAMTLSDQVVIMNDGMIMQKASPYDVYHNPNNVFVARFMGSPTINTIEATMTPDGVSSPLLSSDVDLSSAQRERIASAATGDQVTLGIRPSDLKPVDDDTEPSIEARVNIFEQMGDDIILHLKSAADEQDLRALAPPHDRPERGETFTLGFDVADLHVFDGRTGEALANGFERAERESPKP
ncbi:ABC transporter ATP-binding protein [Halorarum halobium]|uniref:ABC transporter ATP-binding protein n=1 Tax=Halorarum halobium TaxID=3075121 RepID=UPI0028AF72F8|nr:ABC transporter ATP-binding protein [Halobaculum sp. XH14]